MKESWIKIGWSALFGRLSTLGWELESFLLTLWAVIATCIPVIPYYMIAHVEGKEWNPIYSIILGCIGFFLGFLIAMGLSYYFYKDEMSH